MDESEVLDLLREIEEVDAKEEGSAPRNARQPPADGKDE